MEGKKSEVRKVCQNCGKYDRCTKKCSVNNKFTARKASCGDFAEKSV